ncbi:hypothetical protein OHS18_24235 [Amycolatopsis sp. NBC_00355]|uniref:hypothetical protein n=1 Tax=Amycolatopsis sp. NBC_00355 TaxID=2975957 RepID=UPI002E274DF6
MLFSALTSAAGRTARTAAGLAVLGGLVYLVGLLLDVVALVRFPDDAARTAVHAAVDLVLAAALLPGGVLLLRHDPLGRVGCIAGSATAIVATLTSLLLAATGLASVDLGGPGDLVAGGVAALFVVLPPAVVTLALAVAAPTARWCGLPVPGRE